VVSLALAGAVTYAAASASTGKGSAAPSGVSNPAVVGNPTATPSAGSGERDDEHNGTRSPAAGVQRPQPGGAPVAVTGGS
jgi:hypothetical protein